MHLLRATAGSIDDGSEAVDLGQEPGDILFLSAADSELSSLAHARAQQPAGAPSLRLANPMHLGHPMSVDLYVEAMVPAAKLVVVRLLGGIGYWPYGVEQIQDAASRHGVPVAFIPGDDQPDPELAQRSSLPAEACHRLWQYFVHGGPANTGQALAYAGSLIGAGEDWSEPRPLLRAGLYWPGSARPDLASLRAAWREGAPVVAIVFYRALVQAGNLAPVDALIGALGERGLNPLPLFAASLKDAVAAEIVSSLLADSGADLVLNATGFAISAPGAPKAETPFDGVDGPVLQIVLSGSNEAAWRDGTNGLSARDIAMNVALPEVDGRVLSRAVSFKAEDRYDPATQCSIVSYAVVPDRVAFVADLARNWLSLGRKPAEERRIALVLANYPNRDGRIGNGVGLDTPAGTVAVLEAMAEAGYDVAEVPASGNALIERLQEGPTNASTAGRAIRETLPLSEYEMFFASLPKAVRTAVTERWGPPDRDPFYRPGETDCGTFAIPAFRCGKTVIGLQPARGYNIDPSESYHDPDLVPPHGYFAFYAWLREGFRADAIVHMGKHGNLEWLPGKALALSEACFPEAALGPMPHLYPFIVNDPGEGTQAKRRAQAVIVDHLTPPLTRAETYGPLADLERLVDEYFDAAGLDRRRVSLLRDEILDLTRRLGLDKDCGIATDAEADDALAQLDNYLCELKEMQIRDGLHVFGRAPEGEQRRDLLIALTRLPRGQGKEGDDSILRALCKDFGFDGFDPLDCGMGEAWERQRPNALVNDRPWRTVGDTIERLEELAQALVSGERSCEAAWTHTRAVLDAIRARVAPAVDSCGSCELSGLLAGLAGRFVQPGPSGAPTRGRLDVLPTGRNFYSVDTRTVPTSTAWRLGWKSASLLLERHRQEHGEWPRRLALSAWGTANMRTGGDDIAQALALMGVQPCWEPASGRLTGFEILPLSVLDRPRVDVTLRISGFFRDAFPAQIDLFDSASRAVADLDEPAETNPLAAHVRAERAALEAEGLDAKSAARRAGHRVFGSKPGAYGAGLQALIDERGWTGEGDLARAYLAWGGYAYGGGAAGTAEHALFAKRLGNVEVVLHNQDNREHDLLDSDDYYQFEGGLAVAVRHLSGNSPTVYHADHSRPEAPKIRRLEEEVARIVRARVVNPKWIAGVMRHGYKGAFEMAATVDYLFAFAATARAVGDHHFDAVYEAYLCDPAVLEFLNANNPAALRDIADRLDEARDRGLWQPGSNAAPLRLAELREKPA